MKTRILGLATLALALALPLAVQAQGGAPPFAGAKKMTTEAALLQAPKEDPSLLPLEKAFHTAGAALKTPKPGAKAKQTYVEAAYKYGYACEYEAKKLSRPVQYRAALALYRKALAVDPKHKPSLDEKLKIEDIYKSMPGGIPK